MDEVKPGSPETGGLTFEPPRSPEGTQQDMGFAPDLLDHAEFLATQTNPPHFLEPAPSGATAAPKNPTTGDYPISLMTLLSLLEERGPVPTPLSPGSNPPSPQEMASEGEPKGKAFLDDFEIGPSITRAPADIAKPPSEVEQESPDDDDATVLRRADALIDMALVGTDDNENQEVHLVFKEDVFSGVHLRLVTTPEGLEVIFVVQDAYSRRQLEGRIEDLMARLSRKGLRIASHRIEVGSTEGT